jgi:hypothetical protein
MVARKNSRLTRVYNNSNELLEQAKKESGKSKIEILELIIHDALFGSRDLNEYLNELEDEIKGWLKPNGKNK